MNRLSIAALLYCSLNGLAFAQVLSEDFDGGSFPPPGWRVVDNTGSGGWLLNTDYNRSNFTGGSGDCAAIDTDRIGYGRVDTELITPVVVLPAGATLEFDHSFRWYSGDANEQADVEISAGGTPWHLLANYSGGSDGYPVGVHHSIDLSVYAGRSVQIRFHLHDSNWDWWWQVDNVMIHGSSATSVPALSRWGVLLAVLVTAVAGLALLARRLA